MALHQISRAIGFPKSKLIKSLERIAAAGVSSEEKETGAIYNRRMVKDEHIRKVRTQSGSLGGNPNLIKQKTTTIVKQNQTTGVNQKTTPSFSSSTSVSIPSPIHNSNTEISSVPIDQNAGELEKAKSVNLGNGNGKPPVTPADYRKIWAPIESHIRQNIVDETFQKYYAGCTIVSFKHDAVTLAVPDSLIEYETSKDQAQMRLAAMIEESQTGLLRGRKLVIKTIGEVVSKALTS